jgi:DNA polymerase III delta prime subunit
MQNINKVLEREQTENEIKNILMSFDENCKNINFKKGIYLYGSPGSGKTYFIINLLKELNYDVIKYDAGDVRNKSLIETITSNNVSNRNVLHMMNKQVKKIAIVMDEIDGMNNGDKGGITSLIKLIRQKKTKKQRLEDVTLNPIICIGNYYKDKKIKELMKVCNTFELKKPTLKQMEILFDNMIVNSNIRNTLLEYIQGDFRKLEFIKKLHYKNPEILNENLVKYIFHNKIYNEDSKKITQLLINNDMSIDKHNTCMNETDRTIVALLWHENIVDAIDQSPQTLTTKFPFYLNILDNMCFADYMDRITFQNQIWQFNEMSSLIKTFHNNTIYHSTFPENTNKFYPSEIRFTKVLTKYSTEYNNVLFVYNMCKELDMDKKDMISFFQELRLFHGNDFYNQTDLLNNVSSMFENYNINKFDIKRLYRYLDKNVKKEVMPIEFDLLDEDLDE